MYKKTIQIIFLIVFFALIGIPLLTTNLEDGKISTTENRKLVSRAHIHRQDGSLNTDYIRDVENWFNDNVGLRTEMVYADAKVQYVLFDKLPNGDFVLGPNNELNYATLPIINDYQRINLPEEDYLNDVASAYQNISDYLSDKNIQFYYYQCWDKHSIYPEYFPKAILQNEQTSRTDLILGKLKKDTTINVVSSKEQLIRMKGKYETYSVWGDATHWSDRGAYIGYLDLMDAINKNNNNKFKILQESDYIIEKQDVGSVFIGGIHKEDFQETFTIKNPTVYDSGETPYFLSQWQLKSRTILCNDSVDNNTTCLIIGDSYFDNFLYDDIAESFAKTVFIWGDYTENLDEIVEVYQPSIVIIENAERCERTGAAISFSTKINRK